MSYYVHIYEDDIHHGPFSLKRAKQFGRIGSSFGQYARVITRGLEGPDVRVYLGGVRKWPTKRSQLRGLSAGEIPSDLK